jgi:hypothetical protein
MERIDIVAGVGKFVTREATMAKILTAGLIIPPKPLESASGVDLFSEWEAVKRRYGGLSNIPYSELGDYLDKWTGMISYARWCEAVADIDRSTAEEIRDTIKKQLFTIQAGNRELRDASVFTEELYIEWENKYSEASAMYTAVRALREGYEGRATAVSREITRRGGDLEDTRRSMNRGLHI